MMITAWKCSRPSVLALGVLLAVAPPISAQSIGASNHAADGRSDLRVLLVGHDPENPFINYEPTDRMVALHQERTGAFRGLLERHFRQVTVVFANDYEVSMSHAVDVTVFDAKPKPAEVDDGSSPWGPALLPVDFTRPVLTIGEVTGDIGLPIGLKLDWL